LRVAMRALRSGYFIEEDGSIKGFNYTLAKSMAEYLDVDLEVKVVEFDNYYEKDGNVPEQVKTDPYYSYVPDLFNEVHMYCDTLTILPWREKIMSFVETAPVRQMVVTRAGEEIESYDEIDGKKVVLLKNSSFEKRIKEIINEYSIDPEVIYIKDSGNYENYLAEGRADMSIRDSNRAIVEVQEFELAPLSVSFAVSDVQYLGWAVQKDNEVLKGIVRKYLDYAREKGILNQSWYGDFNMTLYEYMELLDVVEE